MQVTLVLTLYGLRISFMDDVVRTVDQTDPDIDMIVQLQTSLHMLIKYINSHGTLQELYAVQGYLSTFIADRLYEG